jgi:hypothetical protein
MHRLRSREWDVEQTLLGPNTITTLLEEWIKRLSDASERQVRIAEADHVAPKIPIPSKR